MKTNNHLLSHTVFGGQNFRSDLTEWSWLRLCQKAVVTLGCSQLKPHLTGLKDLSQGDSRLWLRCWQKACFLPHGPFHRAVGVPSWHGGWLPPERVIQKRISWKFEWLLWCGVGRHPRSLPPHCIHWKQVPTSNPQLRGGKLGSTF